MKIEDYDMLVDTVDPPHKDIEYINVYMSNGWRVTVNEQGVFIDDSGGEEVHDYRWEDNLDEESL